MMVLLEALTEGNRDTCEIINNALEDVAHAKSDRSSVISLEV